MPRIDEATITDMVNAYRAAKGTKPDTPAVDPTKTVANYHGTIAAMRADASIRRAEHIAYYGIYSRLSAAEQIAYEMERAFYTIVFGERTTNDLDDLITAALALRAMPVRH